MKISIYRKAHFNAAHRLYVNEWSEERNEEVFGPCARPNFHGHNYELEVRVTGPVDPTTGMVMNLKDLKDLIKVEIEDRFDHRNLNLDTDEFRDLNPTAENICITIWQILRRNIQSNLEIGVRLYETPRNYVEYGG